MEQNITRSELIISYCFVSLVVSQCECELEVFVRLEELWRVTRMRASLCSRPRGEGA